MSWGENAPLFEKLKSQLGTFAQEISATRLFSRGLGSVDGLAIAAGLAAVRAFAGAVINAGERQALPGVIAVIGVCVCRSSGAAADGAAAGRDFGDGRDVLGALGS